MSRVSPPQSTACITRALTKASGESAHTPKGAQKWTAACTEYYNMNSRLQEFGRQLPMRDELGNNRLRTGSLGSGGSSRAAEKETLNIA